MSALLQNPLSVSTTPASSQTLYSAAPLTLSPRLAAAFHSASLTPLPVHPPRIPGIYHPDLNQKRSLRKHCVLHCSLQKLSR